MLPCEAGQRWQWDGVQLQVLHPPAGPVREAAQALRQSNAASCVLLVRSATGATALLAGDIEARQERALADGGVLSLAQGLRLFNVAQGQWWRGVTSVLATQTVRVVFGAK